MKGIIFSLLLLGGGANARLAAVIPEGPSFTLSASECGQTKRRDRRAQERRMGK